MSYNIKPEKEVSFESTIIPVGTLVECVISGSDTPKGNDKGNFSLNWELTVLKGPYKDARFYDNIGTAGADRYVTQGKMKMSYALEINRSAHVDGKYDIENFKIFNGMRVVIKTGVEIKVKDGKAFYVNKAVAYGSPRPDSRNHEIWKEYVAGNQPYQTDELPPLPRFIPTNGNSSGSMPPAGHPALDDAYGF